MTPLYAYSLVPVFCIALLLFFTAALRGRNARGLAAYCGATALWAGALLLTYFPEVAWVGRRLAACGTFVVAGYLHAAYDFTGRRSYALVWLAYGVAVVIAGAGALFPGLLYDPVDLSGGPFFWESMAMAMGAVAVPMFTLVRGYLDEESEQKRREVRGLFLAGILGYTGAWANALLLAHGTPLPWGLWGVLASLLILAGVVQHRQRERDRRLMERSLSYAAVTAFLSAGFLFGVLTLMSESAEPLSSEYRFSALFLLFMAALAFEPVRQHLQEALGRRMARGQTHAGELADELAEQERRADQAARLAELGTFTSAIAHEVRNPLGVLSACVRVLEYEDVDEETVEEMREQIGRASEFLDELLAYGRPRELNLRMLELGDVVDLAISSARQALDGIAEQVEFARELDEAPTPLEADQAQLTQVLVILFENALLALDDTEASCVRVSAARRGRRVHIVVEDDGPGLPDELRARLFEPFVTGRKREGKRTGTGLGLAIARRIVERHGGAIAAVDSEELGGAKFVIDLPIHQNVLAAATAAEEPEYV